MTASASAWSTVVRAARWLAPRLRTAGRATAAGSAHASRFAWRHRRGLVEIGTRLAWWGALWLAVVGGVRLLGWQVDTVDAALWRPFAIGLALCATVVVLAPARHLRWMATALGTAHGGLGLLAWAVLYA